MNVSFGSEFNATQTTDGAAAEKKSEGIAPVLIKQLLKSAEGNFQMFGMNFSMVCIRAIVRNIETSSTKITYLLEDNTGQITAHYWLEEGDTLKAPDVMLNKYATIYGSVRSQGGQKTIMVFKMLPINDPNEIVTHVLDVLCARYKAEQYASSFSGHNFVGASKVSTAFDMPSSSESHLDGKKLAVLQAIKTHQSPDGINRNELKRKFQQMKESELNSILDFLITEGYIYSSIDADHFMSTE